MYTPHPFDRQIASGVTEEETDAEYFIRLRDLARLQQISEILTRRLIRFEPHLVLVFARGAIPLNFSILRRLNTRDCNQYLDGRTFHLFPGLAHQWEGLGIPPDEYFQSEMRSLVHTIQIRPIRIFMADGTRTGRTLLGTLRALSRLGSETKTEITLSMHAILDEERSEKVRIDSAWEIPGSQGKTLRVWPIAGLDKPPQVGTRRGSITFASWSYYPIGRLFYEDFADYLGGAIVDTYLRPVRRRAILHYTRDDGQQTSGSAGLDELSKRFVGHLAEDGPEQISRRFHLEEAQKTGPDYIQELGLSWREIMKRVDPSR